MDINKINGYRTYVALITETIDYFRIIPRVIIFCYAYTMWNVVNWYMNLLEPTTQHAALITTLIGASAAIIGLYQKSGHSWGKNPLIMWRQDYFGEKSKIDSDD